MTRSNQVSGGPNGRGGGRRPPAGGSALSTAKNGKLTNGTKNSATSPAGNPEDRWRVDGPRLCVLNHAFSQDEKCYSIAVAPDGAVQFFIDEPGSEYHGLLTSVVRTIYDGPPRPEPRPTGD